MAGDIIENAVERADLYRIVIRNRYVMDAILLGRKPDMRTSPAHNRIAKSAKSLNEVSAGEIPRQTHAANTSSRTKCSRIILGCFVVFEMTGNGIAHIRSKFVERFRFGEYRMPECAGTVAAFGRVFDNENDLTL